VKRVVLSFFKEKKVASVIKEVFEDIEDSSKIGIFKRGYLSWVIKDLNYKIEKDPKEPIYYYLRALIHNIRREYAEAKKDLKMVPINDEEFLKRASKHDLNIKKDFFIQSSISEFNLGNYDIATEYFIKGIMGEMAGQKILDNKDIQHYVRGFKFREIGKNEEAKKEYEKLLALSPNLNSEALKKFSESPEKDHPAIENLIKKDFFFVNLADIERELGNAENAIKYYEKSLEINPQQPRANYMIPELKAVLEQIKKYQ